MKPILVSGIQPTGKLHLGNYLGALKNFVDLQNSGRYECLFFIADLHSLTESFSPKEKQGQILDLFSSFLAAGLDPKKSLIYLQSAVPANAELAWILNTLTPFGELRRMTQFKDKSETAPENINVGLFSYPTLMAADILLYDAKYVPVGDDQLQHLELARTLARKFNGRFGKTFVEPQSLLTEIPRLMSLDDPTKKMSKSQPSGCLFLDDAPDIIRSKIKTAVTDSGREVTYNPERKKAVSSLILIYSALSGKSIKAIEQMFKGKGYGEFKKSLAEAAVSAFAPFQKKKRALLKRQKTLHAMLARGNKKALEVSTKKMENIKKSIGLSL
ncbi:MAG: tryptophan--tRNA ligase [Patescibacteria group bacterium]